MSSFLFIYMEFAKYREQVKYKEYERSSHRLEIWLILLSLEGSLDRQDSFDYLNGALSFLDRTIQYRNQ